jgi:transcriptional regulator with XRE-family HTH domain
VTASDSRLESPSIYDVANLGARLHALRIQKGLTLDELAETSGVPASTISKIERNKLKPSFTNAIDLATALEENFGFLVRRYRNDSRRRSVVKKEARSVLRYPEMGVTLSDISGPFLPGTLEARHAVLRPGAMSGQGFMQHPGEEICHVLKGAIEFFVASKRFKLSEGDTIHLDCTVPHRWHNIGRTEAHVLHIFSEGISF